MDDPQIYACYNKVFTVSNKLNVSKSTQWYKVVKKDDNEVEEKNTDLTLRFLRICLNKVRRMF